MILMIEEQIVYKEVDIEVGGKTVLQNVNIKVGKGEFCFFVGKSGSGKSTLLKSFHGASKIVNGDAVVLSQNLCDFQFDQRPILRRRIGIIFQESLLLASSTIYDNLAIALRAADEVDTLVMDQKIKESLEAVNISIDYSTVVSNLSSGQKQRVALARAIINEPLIIVADEPTASLDEESSDNFMRLLFNIAMDRKITVVISSHDNELIKKYPARTYKIENETTIEL